MGNVCMAHPDGRVYTRGFSGGQHTYMRVFGPFLFCAKITRDIVESMDLGYLGIGRKRHDPRRVKNLIRYMALSTYTFYFFSAHR